jgi:3-oxoacyl-[acyl-carrier-protein] synthase-3
MRGNEVFRMAVRNMVHSAKEALHRAELSLDDLRIVIPHQANSRIITATQDSLGVDPSKVFVNVDRYGNTGAASVGVALGEYMLQHELVVGDNVLLVAFGGGLTWGAAVLRWADIAQVRQERNQGKRVAV